MIEATLFNPSAHAHLISQFVDLQIACIESDRMVADYLLPLNRERMSQWWAEKAAQVAAEAGSRHIIFMEENSQATGIVMLQMNTTETGGFRGEVQKLLVSPQHRQRGIARRMMGKLEEVAKAEGRTLLLLDTERGSPADGVYPKWGYKEYGVLPRYERSLDEGYIDGAFYYKDLAAPGAISLI